MRFFGGFILIILAQTTFAQLKSIVYFTDKQSVENYSLSIPASERRAKQGLFYDKTDLPVTEQYLVTLKERGAKVLAVSKWLNAALIDHKVGADFMAMAGVDHVVGVTPKKVNRTAVAEEIAFGGKQAASDKNFIQHNAQVLVDSGFSGKGMHIAVFDAGFRGVDAVGGFEKLRSENRIFFTRDMINGGSVYQYDEHGTQVLSTMAGYIVGQFRGTALDATYSLFVTENIASETQAEEFNWVLAAELADSLGVDVINSSLGYTEFDDVSTSYKYINMDGRTAISSIGAVMAARKGILVVNSAGNSRNQSWKYIGAPADADSILTVGAVREDGVIASFSSAGPTFDRRIKPEVSALGVQSAVINFQGELRNSNGTSFASPIMAGLAASFWQSMPGATNMEIRQAIINSSNRLNTPDSLYGYGIPNFALALENRPKPVRVNTFGLYPNPAKRELYLSTGTLTGPVTVILYTTLGQELGSQELFVKNNQDINISTILPNEVQLGTYFVVIKHPAGKEERVVLFE